MSDPAVKEIRAMAQTLHPLDFPPLNSQPLNVIDTPPRQPELSVVPRGAPTWTTAEPRRCCAHTRSTAPDARVDLRECASPRPASSSLFRTISQSSASLCRKVP